jgi:hypothetical protein
MKKIWHNEAAGTKFKKVVHIFFSWKLTNMRLIIVVKAIK